MLTVVFKTKGVFAFTCRLYRLVTLLVLYPLIIGTVLVEWNYNFMYIELSDWFLVEDSWYSTLKWKFLLHRVIFIEDGYDCFDLISSLSSRDCVPPGSLSCNLFVLRRRDIHIQENLQIVSLREHNTYLCDLMTKLHDTYYGDVVKSYFFDPGCGFHDDQIIGVSNFSMPTASKSFWKQGFVYHSHTCAFDW